MVQYLLYFLPYHINEQTDLSQRLMLPLVLSTVSAKFIDRRTEQTKVQSIQFARFSSLTGLYDVGSGTMYSPRKDGVL